MAADIAELRAIMTAAAKHFKIELPRPDGEPPPSQARVNLESIKLTDQGYDEEATIRQQMALLPTEATLQSISIWDEWPLGEPSWDRAKPVFRSGQSRRWPELPNGFQPIIEWWLHDCISTDVAEFGYTADGYPCKLGTPWDQDRQHLRTVELFLGHTVIGLERQYLRVD